VSNSAARPIVFGDIPELTQWALQGELAKPVVIEFNNMEA
jgi:hypothetical protein